MVPFGRSLGFEGGPQIASLDIEADRMRKNGVLDRVLKETTTTTEFTIDFRCQNEMPEIVEVMF